MKTQKSVEARDTENRSSRAVGPCINYLTSLCINFFVGKMESVKT